MENSKKKKLLIGAAIGAVVLVAAIIVLILNLNRIKASTMRLLRIVGEVTLEDGKKKKTIIDNLRLSDGNALSTAAESLASVGLDDTKIISVEENSRAEFYQKGTVFFKEYVQGSVPSEEELQQDLANMLDIYREYIEIWSPEESKMWSPTLEEYNPGITKEQWLELLKDGATFTENAY